jgi:crossover junction endodeoxyribonuclease RusA
MTERHMFVPGLPVTQGNKRHVGNGVMVESKNLKPWRATIVAAIQERGWHRDPLLAGPVQLDLEFLLPRPGYHYGTGRNAGLLKPSAPIWHDKRGDLDKFCRSVFDSLTDSGAIRDDAQIAWLTTQKRWSATPGVGITLAPMEPDGVQEVAS